MGLFTSYTFGIFFYLGYEPVLFWWTRLFIDQYIWFFCFITCDEKYVNGSVNRKTWQHVLTRPVAQRNGMKTLEKLFPGQANHPLKGTWLAYTNEWRPKSTFSSGNQSTQDRLCPDDNNQNISMFTSRWWKLCTIMNMNNNRWHGTIITYLIFVTGATGIPL